MTDASSAASCTFSSVAAAGAIARKLMVHGRQSITASYAERGVASGKKPVPGACRERTIHRHADDRLHTRQSAPLGIGRKRGEQKQAVGRSRGGRNTKIHALADAKGRLIAILLTGGEAHDCPVAERLIRRVKSAKRMLGDKAYDSAELREELDERGTRRSFQTAAIGSNRSASASASTSFAGASKLHSTG
jgi:transposase